MKAYTCDICECEWAEQEDGLQFGGKVERLEVNGTKNTFDLCNVCAVELEVHIQDERKACQ